MKVKMMIVASAALLSVYANANTEVSNNEDLIMAENQEISVMTTDQNLHQPMQIMQKNMMKAMDYHNPDYAFAAGMLPHHVGAVDMAKVELQYGKDPQMLQLAKNIIAAQDKEIKEMQYWLAEHKNDSTQQSSEESLQMQQELKVSMEKMHQDMMEEMSDENPDIAFAGGMLAHHIGALEMAQIEVKYGKNPQMIQLAKNIIASQELEIKQMQELLEQLSTN